MPLFLIVNFMLRIELREIPVAFIMSIIDFYLSRSSFVNSITFSGILLEYFVSVLRASVPLVKA
jgi:hypothetical protein